MLSSLYFIISYIKGKNLNKYLNVYSEAFWWDWHTFNFLQPSLLVPLLLLTHYTTEKEKVLLYVVFTEHIQLYKKREKVDKDMS